ncbi:MAG: TonB family protein [Melioribacteraceae bacterium]|nr:TonB family protein [Melioribacteraceae bacterium]
MTFTKYLYIFLLPIVIFSQTGIFKSYHINGKVSAELSYSDGIYDGTSYWYYPNGNLKEEKTFSNGKLNGWVRTYYESGLLKEEKYVADGIVNGILKRYFANGALEALLRYEDGFLVKEERFEYDPYYQPPIAAYQAGNRQQTPSKKKESEFICDVNICPEPLGGMDAIYRKLTYPAEAKAYGLEGTVKLVAKVNPDGKVIETKVIRELGLGCDEAAMDAVRTTRFLPGQDRNGVTTANVTLNVEFKLDREKELASVTDRSQRETESVPAPQIGVASKPASVDETATTESQQTLDREESAQNIQPKKQKIAEPHSKEQGTENYFSCSGVDICAEPKGGIAAVLNNFDVPKRVKDKNVKGVVVVLCEVDEHGHVRHTNVTKGLPEGASIAVEVALLATRFEPARKDGKPVKSKVSVTVPVDY